MMKLVLVNSRSIRSFVVVVFKIGSLQKGRRSRDAERRQVAKRAAVTTIRRI